jgi:O-antigen ligase
VQHKTLTGAFSWGRHNLTWLLLVIALFGFAWGELYRPVFIGLALYGIFLVWRHRRALWSNPQVRLLAVLFACLWLPMLASLPDAADSGRSYGTTARYLIYLLAGVAVLRLPWSGDASRRLLWGCFAILLFWTADGLVQFATGANVLGYPVFPGGRLTGMFEGSPRLGLVLAILSPLYFEAVRRLSQGWRWAWLMLLPFVAVILLGGSRASWMIFLVGVSLYSWHFVRVQDGSMPWSRWVWRGMLILLVAGGILTQVDWLSSRAVQMVNLTSGDYQLANAATALRLPLWQAAWAMANEHWLNGVGVHNYGVVFPRVCADLALNFPGCSQGHPHFLLAEIGAETGLIGLIGYLVFLVIVSLHTYKSFRSEGAIWGMSILLAAFPLNSTLPFNAIFSSTLLWLLIIAWLVLMNAGHKGDDV